MAEEVRVNWVRCPSCSWRYYVGWPLMKGAAPAICPKCRAEFDARTAVESVVSGTSSGDPVH